MQFLEDIFLSGFLICGRCSISAGTEAERGESVLRLAMEIGSREAYITTRNKKK